MTDRLRAGIVGAGFMGEVHARAVRAAGGVVARVAASTPERSAAAAALLGAEAPAESAEALLTADDVDAFVRRTAQVRGVAPLEPSQAGAHVARFVSRAPTKRSNGG